MLACKKYIGIRHRISKPDNEFRSKSENKRMNDRQEYMDSAKSNGKLFTLKILHTVVWAIFVFMIVYILYTGILDIIDWFTYFSIATVFVEGIVLLIFKLKCPITIIARRHTDIQEVNFDIFLPKIIAKHNKTIFITLYIIGVIIVIFQKFH